MEIWKPIKTLEYCYEVSNTGLVRSIDRIIKARDGKTQRFYKGQIIKPQITYGGYYSVQLRKNVTKSIFYVHRLVAEHFCDGYKEGLLVNHINEDKLDNRSCNLEFVTKSENSIHSLGKNNRIGSRLLNNDDVIDIRESWKNGESIYSISKRMNQNSGTISNIVNMITYKDVVA